MSGSRTRIGLLISFFGMVSLFAMAGAKAGFTTDIPQAVATTVGISIQSARLLLSIMVLLSVGMILSISRKSNIFLILVVMIGTIGFLTAISWLQSWLLIFIALLISLMFGSKLRDWGAPFGTGGHK